MLPEYHSEFSTERDLRDGCRLERTENFIKARKMRKNIGQKGKENEKYTLIKKKKKVKQRKHVSEKNLRSKVFSEQLRLLKGLLI